MVSRHLQDMGTHGFAREKIGNNGPPTPLF